MTSDADDGGRSGELPQMPAGRHQVAMPEVNRFFEADRDIQQGSDCYFVEKNAFHICAFNTRLSVDEFTCALCSFFKTMWVQPGRHKTYKLLARCSSYTFFHHTRMRRRHIWTEGKHSIILAVVPDIDFMDADEHEVEWLIFDDIRHSGTIHVLPSSSNDTAADSNVLLYSRKLLETVDFSFVSRW